MRLYWPNPGKPGMALHLSSEWFHFVKRLGVLDFILPLTEHAEVNFEQFYLNLLVLPTLYS